MFIKVKRGWEIPERLATPEHVFFNRRQFLATGAAIGATAALVACDSKDQAQADAQANAAPAADDPSASLYPFKRNETYKLDRDVTSPDWSTQYNNYYEFSSGKHLTQEAQALPIRPWVLTIDGMVDKPMQIGIDDLMKQMPLEERLYRHRCVETWSMAVPWSGFALKELVKLAQPTAGAKYLRLETFMNPEVAPEQKAPFYPWPYVEGLTIEEATNDLAFMVTGMYGKPAPKQNGAPLRIALPWKYGFKSAKALVKITFTDQRPVNFWQALQASEYGFWANVNPEVPHPRWSQANERGLGTDEQRPTLIYNGYQEFVAPLYASLQNEQLFM
ncbi:MAG TPA: protein-methionine-sulfoxide reductase catalytic subunit MsrP [Dongiaceae bacterium]|nr:protein-methionine-sulfoxide reductase catalytic subunit MsrP [Dongiaceae bacterium]